MKRPTRIKFPAEPMIYSTATAQELSNGEYISWDSPEYQTSQIKQADEGEKFKISAIGSGFYHLEVDAMFASQSGNEVMLQVEIGGVIDVKSTSVTYVPNDNNRYYLAVNHVIFAKKDDEIKIKVSTANSVVLYKARFIMRWIPIEGWNNRKGGRNMNTFEQVR
jgi:hypothetical protein